MAAHVSSIPQLWSSSLQETRTHMQNQHRTPSVHNNSMSGEGIPMLIHGNTAWGSRQTESTQMKALIKTRPFQYIMATVLVFVLSLVLLITIQPPFTFSSENDEKHATRKFSIARASIYALGATGIGFALASGMYIFSHRQKDL